LTATLATTLPTALGSERDLPFSDQLPRLLCERREGRVDAEKAADGSDREPRIMAFTLRGRCSERVRGRLPLPEALRDELGPLLLAPAVKHLEV
jgi:hypothetical protein